MKILLLHPNIPGQYKHIARILGADPANEVVFASKPKQGVSIPGVRRVEYDVDSNPSAETHRYIQGLAKNIMSGQALWRLCVKLKREGFTPDIICAHPGWGDALFVKDVYPDVPLFSFMEFYYRAFGSDVYFDPRDEVNPDDVARIRIKNATNLFNLEACDWAISPTFWQFQQHPKEFQHKISVLHDGIDTDLIQPMVKNTLTLPGGAVLKQGDEIVTYVARNFEPYRGFPTVMRAIERITKRRPNCHVLVVGSDGVSYGRKLEDNKTYKQQMMDELDIDESRVHFLGSLPHNQLISVYQFSSVHIYYTVPFVLSWSMLEAMSAGCALVASNTPPVAEVINDRENGMLASFFSHEELAEKVEEVLSHPDGMRNMRHAARRTVIDKYDLKKVLPLHLELIRDIADRRLPPPAAKKILVMNPNPGDLSLTPEQLKVA